MQQASDQSIIISEILDSRTKNLVSVSKISDYVLSNELVSMALAMVAEDKQINRVLEELFAEEVKSFTAFGTLSNISVKSKTPICIQTGNVCHETRKPASC